MDVPKVEEGDVLINNHVKVPQIDHPADDFDNDYKDDLLSACLFVIDPMYMELPCDQTASVKLEPVESDEDHKSDDLSTQPSDIHQSSSELHLIEIARHSHPVVLLKRLDVDSLTIYKCGPLRKEKDKEYKKYSTHTCIRENLDNNLHDNINVNSANSETVCDVRGKQFQKAISLKSQKRSHVRNNCTSGAASDHKEFTRKFGCEKCTFVGVSASSLARHLRKLHGCCRKVNSKAHSQHVQPAVTTGNKTSVKKSSSSKAVSGQRKTRKRRRMKSLQQSLSSCESGPLGLRFCDVEVKRNKGRGRYTAEKHITSDHQSVIGTATAKHTESHCELASENVNKLQSECEGNCSDETAEEPCDQSSENGDIISKKSTYVLESQQAVASKDDSDQHQNAVNSSNEQFTSQPNYGTTVEPSASDTLQENGKPLSESFVHKCTICGREFAKLRGLIGHVKAHYGRKRLVDGEPKYCCKKCDFVSDGRSRFERHVLLTHGRQYFASELYCDLFGRELSDKAVDPVPHTPARLVQAPVHELIDVGTNDSTCRLCQKKFTAVSSVRRHILDVHYKANSRNIGIKGSELEHRKCPHCGKILQTRSGFRNHVKLHDTGEQPVFACGDCGLRLKTAVALRTHAKLHSGERSYVCQTCGVAFTTRAILDNHERIHSGEKPHCCEVCGTRFRNASCLIIHRYRHTDEKPYTCSQCSKKFRSSSQMKEHIIVMHTGSKPFSCPACELTFGLRKAMRRHVKVRHGAEYLKQTE